MQLLGANPSPRVAGIGELPAKSHYFIGNDPEKWRTNVPTYTKVRYQDVYPGIDVVYYGNQRELEYDFIIQSGADPNAITLGFEGLDRIELDSQGDLVLYAASGQFRLGKALVYQEVDGVRQTRPDSIHFKDAFVTKIGEQSPFKGTPFPVPGLFEAEDFDLGGEGVAYHDAVAGNAGGLYRTSEDVDIIAANGNASEFVVNNIQTGEWLEYTINVATAGTYRIEPKVSSEFATSRFHVEIDGVDVTGSIFVPNTGWWGTFQFVGTSGVNLTAGQHLLRIYSEQEYFNLDAIQIF